MALNQSLYRAVGGKNCHKTWSSDWSGRLRSKKTYLKYFIIFEGIM